MISIKILLAEDEVDTAEVFKEYLQMELEDVGIYPKWEEAHTAGKARSAVREAARTGEPIEVAIVDLYLKRNRDQDGAMVLREVRKANEEAYVLLVTARAAWDPSFRHKYAHLTNHAIEKAEIAENANWPWRNLARDIRQHLINIGRVSLGGISYPQSDVGIMSVLEDVGRSLSRPGGHEEGARALRLLAFQCLSGVISESADVNIGFLASGKSGAKVCRLDVSGAGEPSQAFVLKFGFDRGALEQELVKNQEASKVLDQSSLMAIVGRLGSHKRGYHAITAKIANRAVSLRDWLVDGATPEHARKVAEIIFMEKLEPFYREDGISQISASEWVRLRPGRKLRSLAVIDRYGGALADSRAGRVANCGELMRRLRDFVSEGCGVGSVINPRREVVTVRTFGDLHSENILVQLGASPQPIFIDATMYGTGHWSSDNARLLVDLLLRVRQAGVESMLWPSGPVLGDQWSLLCPYCRQEDLGLDVRRSEPTEAFIERAVELLPYSTRMEQLGVSRQEWHWEWHLALARELLRQSAYQDLTPPRVCLGLVVAGEHLRMVAELAASFGPD